MLKIVLDENSNGTTTLSIEGRVIGPWVAELGRACEPILASGRGLRLDLSDVSFLSREGVALLRELRDRQVVLLHCSAFVAEQLKADRLEEGEMPYPYEQTTVPPWAFMNAPIPVLTG